MALYGIYGRHEIKDCPWNNVESARVAISFTKLDPSIMGPRYKINKIIGQYHSGLEHTFLWILDAEDPHLIERFAIDTKAASFNEIKIVPLIEFKDVVAGAIRIHGKALEIPAQ